MMKPSITTREKVLLVILLVLVVFCVYYLAFYIPTSNKITNTENAILDAEDTLAITGAKVRQMKAMEAELEAIFAKDEENIRELPAYDNSRNVMRHLYTTLGKATSYDISFATVGVEDSVARRDIEMEFTCKAYSDVRAILQEIHDGEYRCLLKDLALTYDEEDGYAANVVITYFEYIQTE